MKFLQDYRRYSRLSPMDRRQFVKLVGVSTAALMTGSLPAIAEPFETSDFQKLIPSDKNFDPAWVKALFKRGSHTVYRGEDLKYIGMAIGGVCSGQLYLGGDGKLWHWDIFNKYILTVPADYAFPRLPSSPIDQGFTLKIIGDSKDFALDRTGFSDISFKGEYPFGFVEYKDPACPVAVSLEAFSPFAPLATDDSSLPATVMRYTLRNTGATPVDLELTGHLQNGAAVHTKFIYGAKGQWQNKVVRDGDLLGVKCGILPQPSEAVSLAPRPAIVFADFEGATYDPWTTEGNAFGAGPTSEPPWPATPRVANFQGKSYANSYPLQGCDIPQGKLISPEFTVERYFINFLIAGGISADTCINLLVDGNVVRTATSRYETEHMDRQGWDVREYEGKKAHIEIVDHASGPWGHIEIDQIQFEDVSNIAPYKPDMYDFGSMSLVLLQSAVADTATADANTFSDSVQIPVDASKKLVGAVTRKLTLQPGQSHTATFVISWHFPYLGYTPDNGEIRSSEGRYYATKFADAGAVAKYIFDNFERLHGQTKLWHETWYDSTLPYWFLDRTFINISTLATSTAYHFADGRFYAWEGVGNCGGTCTHVWSYEQAMGRLFPDYDRVLRERMELKIGAGMSPDGHIGNRSGGDAAVDGHAGTILRTYRDHQVSHDDAFLKRNWPNIKLAIGWLIAQDGNNDGLIEGAQPNTMDETWYGATPWMSGMYLAVLRAGEEMARDAGDPDFAQKCRGIFDVGQKKFVQALWNEEAGYFFQLRDPAHPVRGSYDGCEIDQVYGQSWGHQVGLGRILPERETKLALQSLWKYNFAPDVGPYSQIHGTQLYAFPGEAGMLICTWPQSPVKRDDCNYATFIFAGIEHQVAGHMIWEDMLLEGFAMERAVHERYHPSKRNPFNEIECGDHYARSMASYGVFVATCGFEYNGPRGTMAFAPRLTPEKFRSAFTAAEGWGTYAQEQNVETLHARIEVKWGRLELKTLTLTPTKACFKGAAKATLGGQDVPLIARMEVGRVVIDFRDRINIPALSELRIKIS